MIVLIPDSLFIAFLLYFLFKKYEWEINVTDEVDTALISASAIMAAVRITVPVMLPLDICAVVVGTLGVCHK